MKKILLSAAAFIALVATAVPAHGATTLLGEQCNTYTNSAGGKAVKACVSVGWDGQSGSGAEFWSRVKFTAVSGYATPYKVKSIDVTFWSKDNIGNPWCSGKGPGCSGVGNISGASTTNFPYTGDTPKWDQHEHYNAVHTHGAFTIEWSSGGSTESHNWNTDYTATGSYPFDDGLGNVNTMPWCIKAGPQDAVCDG